MSKDGEEREEGDWSLGVWLKKVRSKKRLFGTLRGTEKVLEK